MTKRNIGIGILLTLGLVIVAIVVGFAGQQFDNNFEKTLTQKEGQEYHLTGNVTAIASNIANGQATVILKSPANFTSSRITEGNAKLLQVGQPYYITTVESVDSNIAYARITYRTDESSGFTTTARVITDNLTMILLLFVLVGFGYSIGKVVR